MYLDRVIINGRFLERLQGAVEQSRHQRIIPAAGDNRKAKIHSAQRLAVVIILWIIDSQVECARGRIEYSCAGEACQLGSVASEVLRMTASEYQLQLGLSFSKNTRLKSVL